MKTILLGIGRKFGSFLITPILVAGLAIVNAFLPVSVQWSPEEMKIIAETIFYALIAFLAAQGTHDAVKGSASAGTMPTVPKVEIPQNTTMPNPPEDSIDRG